MNYSQNNEQEIIINYFNEMHGNGFAGTLADFGANDGKTLSNSYQLIQNGWNATLIEASKEVAKRCADEHKGNDKVQVINIGVAEKNGTLTFHESGTHLGGDDRSLVSTFDARELPRWKNESFTKCQMEVVDIPTLMKMSKIKSFDFISMDIEGMESVVLPQMDLSECKCICIEYNLDYQLLRFYANVVGKFGLTEIHRNNENVIFAI